GSSSLRSRAEGVLQILLAAGASVVVLFYYVGYESPLHHPPSPGLVATLRTGLQFLGMSVGLPGIRLWPVVSLCVLALCGVSAWLAVIAWLTCRAERLRAAGLLLLLAAQGVMALGVGWGRAGMGPEAGFSSRYVTLTAPLLCCVYLLWILYGRPRTCRYVQIG